MNRRSNLLGTFEEMVLLAIVRLGSEAYGMTVRREIEQRSVRDVSIGAVYATLERLEAKGYVGSCLAPAGQARSGRARRFFSLRPAGAEALLEARKLRLANWHGIASATVLEAVRP